MSSFFECLNQRNSACSSLLCIGLDPHIGQLLQPTAHHAKEFCENIIEQTYEYAAAFKPNAAFFEAFGAEGMTALQEVISKIPDNIPVILDVKRGDISTTAEAYAISAYDYYNAGAVTLSPYMGYDSILPFVTGKYSDKGAFILCKTSNPSSEDFQNEVITSSGISTTTTSTGTLYSKVAEKVQEWNVKKLDKPALGLVTGATDIPALSKIRQSNPSAWLLVPGVGIQGGNVDEVCDVALREDGKGLLINVSRGISKADDMKEAARTYRDAINEKLSQVMKKRQSIHSNNKKRRLVDVNSDDGTNIDLKEYQSQFIAFALKHEALLFGSFTLKSGRISPYFFNAGKFSSGEAIHVLGRSYATAIKQSGIEFDVIFGPAYKGIPLATAVSIAWFQLYGESKEVTYNRKEAKDHGEGGTLVGADVKGKRVLIVDDVISAGTAIKEAVTMLRAIGPVSPIVVGVAVSLDRQEISGSSTSSSTSSTSSLSSERVSAIQQVEKDLKLQVVSIIRLSHLLGYIEQNAEVNTQLQNRKGENQEELPPLLERIKQYRANYGVDY